MAPQSKAVTLLVRIAGEDAGASKAFRGARGEVAGLSQEVKGLAVQAGSAFAAYNGFGKLDDAAQVASDLNEAQATTSQVFAESDAVVRAFGRNAADSIGLSERAALQASNAYGGLLQNLGLTEQASADEAVRLVSRASDLAAAWDKPVDQALAAIQSGLAGESEPLKQFGVLLSDARLRQEALNQGIYDGTGVLTANQRAQAALALIYQDSSKAAGQYAREADGLRQRQQSASAEAENAKAAFGQGLIPIYSSLASVLGGVAGAYNKLPGPAQTATSVVAATAVGLAGLSFAAGTAWPAVQAGVGVLGRLASAGRRTALDLVVPTKAVEGLGSSAVDATGKVGGMSPAMSKASAGLGILAAAVTVYTVAQGEANASAAHFKATVDGIAQASEAAGESVESAFRKKLAEFAGSDAGKSIEKLGIDLDEVAAAAEAGGQTWERYRKRAVDASGGNDVLAAALDDIFNVLEESKAAVERKKQADEDLGNAERDVAADVDEATSAVGEQKTALERATEAVEGYMSKAESLHDAERGVVDAHRANQEAQADLAEAVRAAAGDSDEYRAAREAVVDAERGVVDAQERVTDAQRDARDAQADLNVAREEARDRLRDMAAAARDAALAEADANLKVKESRQELERANADPRATALERERAALTVRQAEEDARQAADEKRSAETDNARAQAAGVEGDRQVVEARQRVADANRRVSDAERDLADARTEVGKSEERAAKVIVDARARVEEAQRRSEDAALDEAKAWGDLADKQNGSIGGLFAYRQELKRLAEDLDPASPLARRVVSLISDIDSAIRLGRIAEAGGTYLPPYLREPDIPKRGGSDAGGRGGNDVVPSSTVIGTNVEHLSQTVVVQGTPAQQRRAFREEAGSVSAETARRVSR